MADAYTVTIYATAATAAAAIAAVPAEKLQEVIPFMEGAKQKFMVVVIV
jgi:hypothetical protein